MRASVVGRCHVPSPNEFDVGASALREQTDARAVETGRVDALRDALTVICEHFQHRVIEEDPKFERFAGSQLKRRRLGRDVSFRLGQPLRRFRGAIVGVSDGIVQG